MRVSELQRIVDNSQIERNFKDTIFEYGSIKLPLLRTTFPKMIAEDIVNVQPMMMDHPLTFMENIEALKEKEFLESLEDFIKSEEFAM